MTSEKSCKSEARDWLFYRLVEFIGFEFCYNFTVTHKVSNANFLWKLCFAPQDWVSWNKFAVILNCHSFADSISFVSCVFVLLLSKPIRQNDVSNGIFIFCESMKIKRTNETLNKCNKDYTQNNKIGSITGWPFMGKTFSILVETKARFS